MFQAFTFSSVGVEVETNWATAVLCEATTSSGVPVFLRGTILGCTFTCAVNMIEIPSYLASVVWVFNTNARASLKVVRLNNNIDAAVKRRASTFAELTIPVESFFTSLRRASAVARLLIPMITVSTDVFFANAGAVLVIVDVSLPGHAEWANLWGANASADRSSRPECIRIGFADLWFTNT